jgi:hypothetical protein
MNVMALMHIDIGSTHLNLKMEAAYFSETGVHGNRMCHNQDDYSLN